MKAFLIGVGALFVLSGCGVIFGGMYDRMDSLKGKVEETNATVREVIGTTNENLLESLAKLERLHVDSVLSGSLQVLSESKSPGVRVRAAQTFMVFADNDEGNDQLNTVLGAPFPIRRASHWMKIDGKEI